MTIKRKQLVDLGAHAIDPDDVICVMARGSGQTRIEFRQDKDPVDTFLHYTEVVRRLNKGRKGR